MQSFFKSFQIECQQAWLDWVLSLAYLTIYTLLEHVLVKWVDVLIRINFFKPYKDKD